MAETLEGVRAALSGSYSIERELGRGGMATVYLAEDLRHGRQVAVKVVHAEVAGSVGAERFLREIQIAARLNHPHILPLHDSGEADGLLYYVMPYVEGETLRDRLEREGQLSLEETVAIAEEVADGLAYAHRRGLVHRDVKPENILLASGHAVLVDFGIARALDQAGGERLTSTGIALGTPMYMSPEHWSEPDKIGARSDLYSLACVVYEMLVGEPPFTGQSMHVMMARHSQDPVPSIRGVRPAVPRSVEEIIVTALAKVPAERHGTVEEFSESLVRAAAGDEAPKSKSGTKPGRLSARALSYSGIIAALLTAALGVLFFSGVTEESPAKRLVVLPFENFGPAQQDYFADGITEEITGRLASIGELAVIARTTAMQYKTTPKPVGEIGRELNVAYAIEGSVRRERPAAGEGQVRVSARLISVADGTQMWGDEYEVVDSELFDVQSNIAEQVATALNVLLLEPERERIVSRPTTNLEAYDYYLRGNGHYHRSWSSTDVQAAIDMYREAVDLDPEFALALAQLGRTHAWFYQLGYDRSDSRLEMARAAIDSALTLEPTLPEAHFAQGLYSYWGQSDFERAAREFETAARLQPSNALAIRYIGNIRRRQGRFAEAIATYKRSAELDPRSHIIWFNLGETYLFIRQYDSARAPLERVAELAPEFPEGYVQRARLALNHEADTAEARRILLTGRSKIAPARWRGSFLNLGRIVLPDYRQIVERLEPGMYGQDSAGVFLIKAELYSILDRPERARVYYDSLRIVLERTDPESRDDLHHHARLGRAYAGLGLREEAVETARRAVELLPVSKDAFDGPDWIINMARVYMRLGDHDAALAHLETVLSIPSWKSVAVMRVDPFWAPLKRQPAFEALMRRFSKEPIAAGVLPIRESSRRAIYSRLAIGPGSPNG